MSSTPQDQYLAVCKELERLNHDIARHVQIATEQAQELEQLRQDLAAARALLQKLRGAARLYRGGGVAGQQMGNESYSILVTGHTLGDIDAALASKPNE